MIKLTLFMLDPVRAHEQYIKERAARLDKLIQPYADIIEKMQKKIDKKIKEASTLKHKIHMLENKLKEGT